ncbi:MAG: hypothetical protein HLUCCA08_15410 [Rhodobacteraceae bacterium HLUCCA08]|nr:MAG: hypothetical protein HLUCCA08_15410 [Rhodobacteraceae bacterium HLUCCA08]
MTKILIPSSGPDDWQQFLADPQKQWKRGCSAMAAALSWETAQGLPPEIAALLGPDADLLFAIPEHKVALPGGRRESQCDVFALARAGDQTIAVAVEAKVGEPFGPTVGEWLVGASAGKTKRITFIRDLLGLPVGPIDHVRYQLLHRGAAAVLEAARFKTDRAAMIVQSFSQEHRWFEDFATFAALFGLDAERGTPLRHILPSGRPLDLGWAVGSADVLRAADPSKSTPPRMPPGGQFRPR